MKPVTIKSEDAATFTLVGQAVAFDGHDDDGKDLTGEYFAKDTNFWFDTLGPTKPFLYAHGTDPDLGKSVLGTATLKEMDDGVWFEAQVQKAAKYAAKVHALAEKGLLGVSTGTVEHLMEREPRDGKTFIKSWPIVELSATVVPAEPRLLGVQAVKELVAFNDGLKAVLTAAQRDNLSASDFAWMDGDGTGHMPIHDAEHVRAAMARFNQTDFPDAATRKKAARKIMARAREMNMEVAADSAVAEAAKALRGVKDLSYEGIRQAVQQELDMSMCVVETYPAYVIACQMDMDGDSTYWRVAYSIDAEGDVQIGDRSQVEPAYVPYGTAADPATMVGMDGDMMMGKALKAMLASFQRQPSGAATRPAPAKAEDPPAGKAKEPGMKTLAERIAIDLLLAEVD